MRLSPPDDLLRDAASAIEAEEPVALDTVFRLLDLGWNVDRAADREALVDEADERGLI